MTKLITILSLMTISLTAFAKGPALRCQDQIVEIAQSSIDLKAKGFRLTGLTGGILINNTLEQILDNQATGQITAQVKARFHNQIFEVEVTADRYCTVDMVKITDMGER